MQGIMEMFWKRTCILLFFMRVVTMGMWTHSYIALHNSINIPRSRDVKIKGYVDPPQDINESIEDKYNTGFHLLLYYYHSCFYVFLVRIFHIYSLSALLNASLIPGHPNTNKRSCIFIALSINFRSSSPSAHLSNCIEAVTKLSTFHMRIGALSEVLFKYFSGLLSFMWVNFHNSSFSTP